MQIEFNGKQVETLLKWVAMADFIYGVMSDMVAEKYKKDAENFDNLIAHLLKYSKDESIQDTFRWKKCFSDEYIDNFAPELLEYENWVFGDLLIRNMAKELLASQLHGLDREESLALIFEMEEKLYKIFEKHWLSCLKFKDDIEPPSLSS